MTGAGAVAVAATAPALHDGAWSSHTVPQFSTTSEKGVPS
jgi:hypothetical protein